MSLLLEDAKQKPYLFLWNGPIESRVLVVWLHERHLELPHGLIDLWKATGGGNIFESEQILGPFGDPSTVDDFDSCNAWHHAKGLPANYALFNTGVFFSAINLSNQHYVLLDESSYKPGPEFTTIDQWYGETIRKEFASRYGLT